MTTHELMLKTNHYLIKGGQLTDAHKANITRQLSLAHTNELKKPHFMAKEPIMYPLFFIPPYNNGQKFQTVIPMSPKTHILAANSYELEVIRLLHMFDGQNANIGVMVAKTLDRLQQTCFGYKNCSTGECFEAGIVTLRFISTVLPSNTHWIKKQINVFNSHFRDKRRPLGVLKYFWLCLSEMPPEIAEPEILRHKESIQNELNRKPRKNEDEENHLVSISVMKNVLARWGKGALP
jgi:hypothetical protein